MCLVLVNMGLPGGINVEVILHLCRWVDQGVNRALSTTELRDQDVDRKFPTGPS